MNAAIGTTTQGPMRMSDRRSFRIADKCTAAAGERRLRNSLRLRSLKADSPVDSYFVTPLWLRRPEALMAGESAFA